MRARQGDVGRSASVGSQRIGGRITSHIGDIAIGQQTQLAGPIGEHIRTLQFGVVAVGIEDPRIQRQTVRFHGQLGAREAELSGLESELPRWREERERARNLSEQVGAWIRERDHLTRVRTRSADLDLRRDDLAKRRNTAQAALEETRIRSNVREEEIRTAEVLDVRLESARVGESEKDAAFHAVSGAIAVLEKERTEVADRLETLASRLTETDTYLEANRRLGPVAADWPQCRTLLDVCATALREKTAQEIAAASADGEISRLTPLAEGSERRVRELETSLEGTGPEAILAELDGVESGLRDLEIFRTWMDLDAQEEEARAGLARADSDLDRDSAAVARLEESLKLAKNLLESTRDAASEGAQELRRNLVEGEPCPVCGSPHHPRGPSDAGPLQALLATHQAMVSDRGRELDDLRTSCARAEASRDQMRRDLQRIQGRRESAGSLPLFAEDPPPREASARPRWMERRREAFSAGKKALQDLQRSLGELGGARVRLADLRSELATAQERRRQASEACRKADAELGSRSAELDAKFGGEAWRPRWEADPKGYVVLVEGRVVDFRRSSDLRSATVERIGKETVLRDAIERNLAAKSLESDGARGALDSSREERRRLETERASVLEGMDAASARAAVLDRIHEADAALEASRNDLDACLREMEGLGGALGQIERSLQEIREALSKDGPALSDPAGPPWCGVDADPETLQEFSARILESHSRRTDGAETAAMRLRAELELDTENRRDAEGLAERIRLQSEVVGRWSALSDSVGSADGKAFRVVAQRFTLEVLLEEANRELSRIAPRYDLRIIPDSMHFGVADRDAFGEIRPVHTLSGGESFMVSLALALGLSHLAGGDLRIESLFIDEGFGTLDPTTLRSVMGALSSLHAQGRKVGVVTHVEEMKEQIDVRIEVVRVGPGRSQVRIVG